MMSFGGFGLRNRRRVIVAIVCVVMALCVLVSSAYLAHEAAFHHRCMGEDCPICQFIAQVEQLRRGFGLVLLAVLVACLALRVRRAASVPAVVGMPALCTPVGRKIRLND